MIASISVSYSLAMAAVTAITLLLCLAIQAHAKCAYPGDDDSGCNRDSDCCGGSVCLPGKPGFNAIPPMECCYTNGQISPDPSLCCSEHEAVEICTYGFYACNSGCGARFSSTEAQVRMTSANQEVSASTPSNKDVSAAAPAYLRAGKAGKGRKGQKGQRARGQKRQQGMAGPARAKLQAGNQAAKSEKFGPSSEQKLALAEATKEKEATVGGPAMLAKRSQSKSKLGEAQKQGLQAVGKSGKGKSQSRSSSKASKGQARGQSRSQGKGQGKAKQSRGASKQSRSAGKKQGQKGQKSIGRENSNGRSKGSKRSSAKSRDEQADVWGETIRMMKTTETAPAGNPLAGLTDSLGPITKLLGGK